MKLVIACALLVSSMAHAEPDAPRDPDIALTWSIVGTAVPVAAITLGLTGTIHAIYPHERGRDIDGVLVVGGALVGLITPALGHIYAHETWLTRGLAMRAVGLPLATIGAVSLIIWSEDGEGAGPIPKVGLGLAIAGAALYLGGAASDIVAAPASARHANERLALSPTLLRTGTGTAPGLSVLGQF